MKSREYIVDESGLTLLVETDGAKVSFRVLNTFGLDADGRLLTFPAKIPRDIKVTKVED